MTYLVQEFVEIGAIRVRASKLALARGKGCPYNMARALLPEFFTPQELKLCTTVAGRSGRPQADPEKLQHLLGKGHIITINTSTASYSH